MIQDDIDLFPLRAVRVRSNGKRDYEPSAKRRLIELCLHSGASVSGMALRAGINANQLRKWIREYRDSGLAQGVLAAFVPEEGKPSAFVPVVAAVQSTPVSLAPRPCQRTAMLSARLPDGTTLELSCDGQDADLIKAVVEALGGRG
jgi:transposase